MPVSAAANFTTGGGTDYTPVVTTAVAVTVAAQLLYPAYVLLVLVSGVVVEAAPKTPRLVTCTVGWHAPTLPPLAPPARAWSILVIAP